MRRIGSSAFKMKIKKPTKVNSKYRVGDRLTLGSTVVHINQVTQEAGEIYYSVSYTTPKTKRPRFGWVLGVLLDDLVAVVRSQGTNHTARWRYLDDDEPVVKIVK